MRKITERYRAISSKIRILNKTVEGKPYNFDNYVSAFSTMEDIDVPAGTFEVTIYPIGKDGMKVNAGKVMAFWMKTLEKNDIISIGAETEGTFIGRIDAIRQSKKRSPKRFSRSITIVGRDFAGLLIDDDIVYAPELAQNETLVEALGNQRAEFLGLHKGMHEMGNVFYANSCVEVIMWVMRNMPSISLNVLVADYDENGHKNEGSKYDKIGKYFEFDLKQYKKDRVFDPNLTIFSGKVWQYLEQAIDKMFYELMVDTQYDDKGELKPTLILRPKPFDRSPDCAIKDIIAEEDDPKENGTAVMETKFPDDFVVSAEIESSQKGWFAPLKKEAYDNTVSLYWDNEKIEAKITMGKEGVKDKKIIENKFKTRITNESYHTVYEDEVYEESPTTSILDIVNFITMHPTKDLMNNSVLMKYGYLFPLIDLDSIKRYGMRKLEGWTNLWKDTEDPDNKKKKRLEEELGTLDEAKLKELDLRKPTSKDYIVSAVGINYRARRDQLFNWYRFNPVYVTDNKVVRGRDKYRKGDKIYFPDEISEEGYKGMFYYIKRVNQRVVIRENSTEHLTVLGLVRGGNEDYLYQYYLAKGGNDNVFRINAAWKEGGEGAGNKNKEVEEKTELEFGNLTGDGKDFYEYMTSTKGIKKNNALGLLANIYRESKFNPKAVYRGDPNGGSYGIFQWNNSIDKNGRATMMFKNVPDWQTNWKAQIDYIYTEPTDGGRWRKAAKDYLAKDFKSPEAAALEWMIEWERTAHPKPDQVVHVTYLKSLKIKEVELEPEAPEELTNEEKRKIKRRESGGKVGGKRIYNLTQESIDKAYEYTEAVKDSYTTLFNKYKNDKNLSFAANMESIVMALSDIAFNSKIGDGDFVVSLIHNETKAGGYYTKGAFDPLAISNSGCCGLGQISQGTAGDCGVFSGYQNRILKHQENNKSINDIRHHPILNLKGICAILYMKKWNERDLRTRVVAVCRYGDPSQSSYFEKATKLLETTKPDHEFLTKKARDFASKWYAWYENEHG